MWTPAQVREFGDISRRPWMFTSFTIAWETFRTNLVIAVNRRRSSQQIQQGVTAVEALRERELAHTVIANQLAIMCRPASVLAQQPIIHTDVISNRPWHTILVALPTWPHCSRVKLAHVKALPDRILVRLCVSDRALASSLHAHT